MNSIKFAELTPRYDRRSSFYGKAHLIIHEDGKIQLQSYETIVAEYADGKMKVFGHYSTTTSRHVREFIRQITGEDLTVKEIERRYF